MSSDLLSPGEKTTDRSRALLFFLENSKGCSQAYAARQKRHYNRKNNLTVLTDLGFNGMPTRIEFETAV